MSATAWTSETRAASPAAGERSRERGGGKEGGDERRYSHRRSSCAAGARSTTGRAEAWDARAARERRARGAAIVLRPGGEGGRAGGGEMSDGERERPAAPPFLNDPPRGCPPANRVASVRWASAKARDRRGADGASSSRRGWLLVTLAGSSARGHVRPSPSLLLDSVAAAARRESKGNVPYSSGRRCAARRGG